MTPNTTLIVVSHTHWDREWYLTFQQFRRRLVRLVDRLLDILDEDPGYRYFMLDGQTIVLGDYLDVRPEREIDLRRHIQAGRILVGPWYVLPDEFLVSPEAIIRNLILGLCQAHTWTNTPLDVGYLPDPFGHVAQMPQILRGFGLETACLWRGVPGDVSASEFRWQAPNGSEVLVLWMPFGYGNARQLPLDPLALRARVEGIVANLQPLATTDHLLLMNGEDHLEAQPGLPAALAQVETRLDGIRIVHGTLSEYRDAIRAADPDLPVVTGELRSGQRAPLLPGVLSVRNWIKQRNAACETLLERWAEPAAAWAWALGDPEDRRRFVWRAWRYLLENHPHDSICGCSVDQVHEEMRTRFDWCEQVGEIAAEEALASVVQRVNTAALGGGGDGAPFVVFNPTVGPRTDVVQFEMPLPGPARDLDLLDDAGRPMPFEATEEDVEEVFAQDFAPDELIGMMGYVEGGQVMGLTIQSLYVTVDGPDAYLDLSMAEGGEANLALVAEGASRIRALVDGGGIEVFHVRAIRVTPAFVTFVARDVPGVGYRSYCFARGSHEEPPAIWSDGAEARIENEYFVVDVDPEDGTLVVTDKSTGHVYEGLNGFLDEGDAGDEYNYSLPPEDYIVDMPAEPPTIATYRDAAGQSLVIEMVYELPAGLTEDRQSRSDETVPCAIEVEVALWAGVRRIDVSTTVDNQAADHRLRVHFPAGVHAETSWADGHFLVVERPVDLPVNTADWVEQPIGTHPQRAWCSVGGEGRGLTIANRGLYEFEAFDDEDEDTILTLTLLRCVGWLSRADIAARPRHAGPGLPAPGAQSLGEHVFEYSIIPHAGDWREAAAAARAFAVPLRAVSTETHEGTLPPTGHLLEVDEPLVASAIKRSEDGRALVVRLYNHSAAATKGRVRPGVPCQREVLRANLNEDVVDLPLLADEDGWVYLAAGPWEVVTLRFVPVFK